jgi:hypothetical protein
MGSFGNSGRSFLRRSNSSTARRYRRSVWTLQRKGVVLPGQAMEAVGQGVVTILLACDFDITIAHELGAHWRERSAVVVEGHVKTGSEDAGLETGGAEHGLLRESHLLEGEQLLGVDGLVDGQEVVLETGDLIKFFESDDGEGGGGEAVSAGILARAGLAVGSARAGALGGVGAVGRVLFFGDGHKNGPFNQQIA